MTSWEIQGSVNSLPLDSFAVHRVINSRIGSIFPSGLQRAILDGLFTVGRAQVSETLLNESNPLGSSRLAKLRHIFEEGRSLQLQFPAEDLGFRYPQKVQNIKFGRETCLRMILLQIKFQGLVLL